MGDDEILEENAEFERSVLGRKKSLLNDLFTSVNVEKEANEIHHQIHIFERIYTRELFLYLLGEFGLTDDHWN